MSSNNMYKSDLANLYDFVQSSMIVYPKEAIIALLRDYFSKDDYYHYSKDQWGFANTTDHTDLPLGADIPKTYQEEFLPTRLFIGENYRQNVIFYPAVLVKSGGSKYVPISINRNKGTVQYENIYFDDGYGNLAALKRPKSFVTAGAWEGSIIIDIYTRSLRSRDDLAERIAMFFTEVGYETLVDIGIIVKPLNIGAPSEGDDRNDKLFKISLTLDIRSEWRREIPVGNLIESINFAMEFANLEVPDAPVAQNLTINTEINYIDLLLKQ